MPATAPRKSRAASPKYARSAPAPSFPDALQSPRCPLRIRIGSRHSRSPTFTWLNGTPRNKGTVLDTRFFTPEVPFDTHFLTSFNQPKDHSLGGATESLRRGEFRVEQISVGGDSIDRTSEADSSPCLGYSPPPRRRPFPRALWSTSDRGLDQGQADRSHRSLARRYSSGSGFPLAVGSFTPSSLAIEGATSIFAIVPTVPPFRTP